MKNIIIKIFTGLLVLVFLNACSEDDNTGFSTVKPNNITVTTDVPGSIPALVERDSAFTYTITLSAPQTVDVQVAISQIDGTAVDGEDFVIPHLVTIKSGDTSVSFDIEVLDDDLIEDTETFTLEIGANTANASLTPVTVKFTIENATGDGLNVDLSWSSRYDLFDEEDGRFDVYDFADLRLLITDASGAILKIADGASAESLTLPGTYADGTYFIKADVYVINNLGDLESNAVELDLAAHATQKGVLDQSYSFPAIMNSSLGDCPGYTATLLEIVKVGENYTISNAEDVSIGLCIFVGAYDCDEPGYKVYDVNFGLKTSDPFTLTNDNFWDSGFEVDYVFDNDGNVVITPYEFDANYGRGVETWVIEGAGTYDLNDLSMVVPYTVAAKADGAVLDNNIHTFTKK